jgi:adenylosuccinate synthase
MNPGTVTALVGAQYGSEGKGAIAAKIAKHYEVHVRTGAPNAGHTYYVDMQRAMRPGDQHERVKVVARSIPVGASNQYSHLIIGAGGIIDVANLFEEIEQLKDIGIDVSGRLMIDSAALIIDKVRHADYEGHTRGHAHEKIGSTGEGVGIARMAHIARGVLAHDWAWGKIEHAGDERIRRALVSAGVEVRPDTSRLLDSWIRGGQNVLLEGTQGSGLSSVHGPWPYVTSTDTNAGQLLVDAGISPSRLSNVILVARTYPIRVAGNSGPLKDETSWEEIGVEPERTTVTKKVRRVGKWDKELLQNAIRLNGPHPYLALTFADYIDPSVKGSYDYSKVFYSEELHKWWIANAYELNVSMDFVGTGPDSVAVHPSSRWAR